MGALSRYFRFGGLTKLVFVNGELVKTLDETAATARVLRATGAPGAAATVFLPALIGADWLAINDTDQDLTVKIQGGTGATLSAGESAIVVSPDGSNIVSGHSLQTSSLIRPPPVASWTWVNQGTGTATDSEPGICLTDPTGHAGASVRMLVRALPANKTHIMRLSWATTGGGTPFAGFVWRESASGKLVIAVAQNNGAGVPTLSITKYTNPTTWLANYQVTLAPHVSGPSLWIKAEIDAVNRIVRVSADGTTWILVHSVAKADHCVPDQAGIAVDAENAPVTMSLEHWSES